MLEPDRVKQGRDMHVDDIKATGKGHIRVKDFSIRCRFNVPPRLTIAVAPWQFGPSPSHAAARRRSPSEFFAIRKTGPNVDAATACIAESRIIRHFPRIHLKLAINSPSFVTTQTA